MLLKKDEAPEVDYLENWPEHYYEIEDVVKKRVYLKKALEQGIDSEHDAYRMKLLERRYFTIDKSGTADAFMHAWMMMKATTAQSVSFFQKKHLQREWKNCLKELCLIEYIPESDAEKEVLIDEWTDFARSFLISCTGSRGYRSTLFGILPMKDDSVAMKIAEEIQLVTRTFPEKLGMEAEMEPFREILVDTYLQMISQGEIYWEEVTS